MRSHEKNKCMLSAAIELINFNLGDKTPTDYRAYNNRALTKNKTKKIINT